ncbi:MAG: helix-turn-helix domain-containing protein, partial [Muribaculaceae bacterium]|nr:helix-turn-helix domain-containing protein [Muribaculaceae bacterium]
MYASEGDYAASLADIDTLLNTHRCFPWFYLRDLRLKAEILNDAGLHAESARTYSRYIAYHDSLSAKLTDRRLKDLTLLYRSELAREEKRTNTMRLLGMGSVTLMLLILLGVTYKNTLTERKRNRLLVERLHEFDRTSHTLIEKIAEQSQETEEASLISRLDRYMATEQPYCDPTLGRKELAEYLGISQDALAQLIRTEYDQTVHSYINFFRSEEGRRIIDCDSKETIRELAQRLGFGTPRTLHRGFKERFDR